MEYFSTFGCLHKTFIRVWHWSCQPHVSHFSLRSCAFVCSVEYLISNSCVTNVESAVVCRFSFLLLGSALHSHTADIHTLKYVNWQVYIWRLGLSVLFEHEITSHQHFIHFVYFVAWWIYWIYHTKTAFKRHTCQVFLSIFDLAKANWPSTGLKFQLKIRIPFEIFEI